MSAVLEEVTLGPCRLILGDCLDVLPLLDRADAVVTDPPYGIGESSKDHSSRNNRAVSPDYKRSDWDNKPPDLSDLLRLIACAPKAILWGGNYFGLPAASKWLVWDKLNTGDFADCELAWTNLPGAVRKITHMWNGMLRDSERNVPRVHPTQKPVVLMQWCLEQAKVATGETVADFYMGSGTTGIACIRTGRKFIGIEKDPAHYATAVDRIRRELQQQLLPL